MILDFVKSGKRIWVVNNAQGEGYKTGPLKVNLLITLL